MFADRAPYAHRRVDDGLFLLDRDCGTAALEAHGKIPPIIILITSDGKIKLDEETVGQLDWTRIKNADMIIRPYNYPARSGRPAGVSAYLKCLYVTVAEDDLATKYADIPFIDSSTDEYEED